MTCKAYVNLQNIINDIPDNIKIVAVSKNRTVETIQQLYNSGHNIFGENRAQEFISKAPDLPIDIEWHFIGHLQTNKVKMIMPYVSVVHSVDSFKLLKEINKQARKSEKTIKCLLQFHIAQEESKYGLSLKEANEIIDKLVEVKLNNILIIGVMGMATFTKDCEVVSKEFRTLKDIFHTLKNTYFSGDENFREISMGMSDDYKIAIKEGATIIRIGSCIFDNAIQ